MSITPRFSFLLKIIPLLLIICTGFYLFHPPTREILGSSDSINHLYHIATTGRKGDFVQRVLDGPEIDGPANLTALTTLCRETTWTPGLIIKCDPPRGGIGHVRNTLLSCIRYGIEAGGTSLIMPEIIQRGEELTNLETNTLVPFSYFFDTPHFTQTLAEACPQITIIPHANDLFDIPSTSPAIEVQPTKLTTDLLFEQILASPQSWAAALHEYLNTTAVSYPTVERPVLIVFRDVLLTFPLFHDDPYLVANFGRLLRFRSDVCRLAASALFALNQRFHMDVQSGPGFPQQAFFGAHLRTAADAAKAGWTTYAPQARTYLHAASTHELSVIYSTTGSPSDFDEFVLAAANLSLPITVVSKTSLFSSSGFETERVEMEALTWDQQALIDYEVLLRSSIFGGITESTFSWNVAMRRHVVVGGGHWVARPPRSPWGISSDKRRSAEDEESPGEGPGSFRDPASVVYGQIGHNLMEYAMWP